MRESTENAVCVNEPFGNPKDHSDAKSQVAQRTQRCFRIASTSPRLLRLRAFALKILSSRIGSNCAIPIAVTALFVVQSLTVAGTNPLSPTEEQKSFVVAPGFRVDLVASEPNVVDPVAMTFDERGRIFVVEMRGYPNGGIGDGKPNHPGRIVMLEDKNGDGAFETSTVFAEGLRFPTGVCCWRGGLIVCDAPDLLYLKDNDGDGKVDERRVLYTGFGTKNIQQLLNGPQFHFDNWIHVCNGANETVVTCPEKPDFKPLPLRGRHFRFRPDVPGSLEPTSGGGQYGHASDDWGNWFTCTNSQHIRQIVLPDQYLRNSPDVLVRATTVDIPDGVDGHHAAAKLYRVSKFEDWRVERTTRRNNDPSMKQRLPSTELVPGGYTTSATGIVVDRGGIFAGPYAGCVFAGDPANNLIHADRLVGSGPAFTACRVEAQREFLTSPDGWFRPVFLTGGPDGCLYVCDFYREVIETPLSLPDDIKAKLNLQTRGRGRIWRIAPQDFKPRRTFRCDRLASFELASVVTSPNAWLRLTAQRLLLERDAHDPQTIASLRTLAMSDQIFANGRLHALWLLAGLKNLEVTHIEPALRAPDAGLRANAIRLCEEIASKSNSENPATALASDPSPMVRFQLALTLSTFDSKRNLPALAALCDRAGDDPWLAVATLLAASSSAEELFESVGGSKLVSTDFVERLAQLAARRMNAEKLRTFLERAVGRPNLTLSQQFRLAKAVSSSFGRTSKSSKESPLLLKLFVAATKSAAGSRNIEERLAAIELLGFMPGGGDLALLGSLIDAKQPAEVQQAAIRAAARSTDPKVAETLFERWPGLLPAARREIQEALFARAQRLQILLNAIADNRIAATDLEPARREQLVGHRDKAIAAKAKELFARIAAPDRQRVIDDYSAVKTLSGDVGRGRPLFGKHCATCHRLEDTGRDVGPDLRAALKDKTAEVLLVSILDPSREVDGRYLNYVVSMTDGRVVSGIIASESASAIVLRRADKVEDVLPRAEIESIRSTGKSLMPEGLEKDIGKQAMADIIAYLLSQKP